MQWRKPRAPNFAPQAQALLGALVNSSNQNKEVVIIFFVQICQKPRSGISCAAAFGCAGVADQKMKVNFTFPILWIGKIWYNRIGKGNKKEVTKTGREYREQSAKRISAMIERRNRI